jgi:glycosyltransferase involved in cell wall biosynthesis
MRIGIDGRALEGKRAGTGRYVFELCKELDVLLPEATFFVYSSKPVEMPIISDRWIPRVEDKKWASDLKSVLWLKTRAGRLCKSDRLDVFWANATFIPSLRKDVRVVSTVHDLAYLIVPKTMKTVTYWAFKLFFRSDIERANKIVCNSKGTADRLFERFGVRASGVVLPAVSNQFRRIDNLKCDEVRDRYSLGCKYLLTVGTLEPRKNLEELIKQYVDVRKRGFLEGYQLVLVGGGGWKNARLKQILAEAGDDGIVSLGFVEDKDLPAIYSGAEAFVFPSIYEGFGMPVMEARACGTPVYATDMPEIREAGGLSGNYFPLSDGLASALELLASRLPLTRVYDDDLVTWKDGAKVLAEMLTSEM